MSKTSTINRRTPVPNEKAIRKRPVPAARFKRATGKRGRNKPGPGEVLAADVVSEPAQPFLIVGLGASAGGLEALGEFFDHMPPESGMAFVVVTHQHSGHKSMLSELLNKRTAMRVTETCSNCSVKPNSVYVARPEGCLGLLGGRLQVLDLGEEPSGMRLPIDYFFRSLAEDQREHAVGIILSGTASDGAVGLTAIKAMLGMTMVQEPESAKYPGMPRSAIATGMVDYVLPVSQLPQRLIAYAKRRHQVPQGMDAGLEGTLPDSIQNILALLRQRTGHDFSGYKPSTIRRRIMRRMDVHQMKGPTQYMSLLRENPHELDLLFKEMLVVVTEFFRDRDHIKVLETILVRDVLASRSIDEPVRVWVPGCATGQEVYSIAILLHEAADRLQKRLSFQVFGTDLDSQAIDVARAGIYPEGIAVDVPHDRLARYFSKRDHHFKIKEEIREMVVFAQHNVVKDPPFSRLDLISCRNLLIYLEATWQKRVLSVFHSALKPDGLLFLGPSEGVGDMTAFFDALDRKAKVYRRTHEPLPGPARLGFQPRSSENVPARATEVIGLEPVPDSRLNRVLERLLLQRFVPVSAIVNDRGDIRFVHGRTGNYLELAPGLPHYNLMEMAREGLRPALASLLRRAGIQSGEAVQNGVRVKTNGDMTLVDVTVQRLAEPESVRDLFLVTFRPSSEPPARDSKRKRAGATRAPLSRVEQLEQEILFTRESLKSTVEELQTTNEELRSSNEELQSTNEENQSTNEELETSKEEMQSLNEELQTVNAQLQSKIEEYVHVNDDLNNLLNSTAIATVFLDADLKIRRFTNAALQMFSLIPSDIGRPLTDLVSRLNYDQLVADAAQVLRTLAVCEQEVTTQDGGWRHVRILPYRTTDNVIDGLVITLVDISRLKRAELIAESSKVYVESILATMREPLLVLDSSLRVVTANRAFLRCFKMDAAEVVGRLIRELGSRKWASPQLRQLLGKILQENETFENFVVADQFPGVGHKVMILNARRLEQRSNQTGLILLAMEDATDKQKKPAGRKTRRGARP
jgi:two-component system, chemotaxis family, CheB/CheR fusion protein